MQGPCLNSWDQQPWRPPRLTNLLLSTRAGCECVAHMLQGVTELVTSIDGVSAYDMISRRAMMDGLRRVDGGLATLPCVRVFHGTPLECQWEDSDAWCIPFAKERERWDSTTPWRWLRR